MPLYNPNTDFVKNNQNFQGIDRYKSLKDQKKTKYPGVDDLQNATLNDNHIYIMTHDSQHENIAKGEALSTENRTALSGYFTSEASAMNRVDSEKGTFDSYGLSRDTCVVPHSKTGNKEDVEDKAHLDRFYIDRDRMEEIYGTRDFNAAIGKCSANNQYGSDGGDQGYNSCLNELYNNGCLKYAGTYDAVPGSTIKCQSEFEQMGRDAKAKCNGIINGETPEDVQKIGQPLDDRCHDKTGFDASIYKNSEELNAQYKDFNPSYKEDLAIATKNSDRIDSSTQKNVYENNKSNESTKKSADVELIKPTSVPQKQASEKSSSSELIKEPQKETVSTKKSQETEPLMPAPEKKQVAVRDENVQLAQAPKTDNTQQSLSNNEKLFKPEDVDKMPRCLDDNERTNNSSKLTDGISKNGIKVE